MQDTIVMQIEVTNDDQTDHDDEQDPSDQENKLEDDTPTKSPQAISGYNLSCQLERFILHVVLVENREGALSPLFESLMSRWPFEYALHIC